MNMTRALVVGNSDGIGLALTRRLLAAGYQTTGVSRSPSPLAHPEYQHEVCDVAEASYSQTLARLLTLRGPFDVCVYCAGIGELLDLSDLSGELQVFRVNLLGLVATSNVLVPAMLAAGRGHLVGLSSIGDAALSAEAPSYSASKAGMSSYLGGLALALRPRGIAVSNVRLGFVDTKMAKSPLKPLMIDVEAAVDVLMRCLLHKPARLTHPWRMSWLVSVLRWLALIKLALPSGLRAQR